MMQIQVHVVFMTLLVTAVSAAIVHDNTHDVGPVFTKKTTDIKLMRVHKRQTPNQQEEICNRATIVDICTSGYQQDYARVSYRCNQMDIATQIQAGCVSNSAGVYCGAFTTFDIGQNIESTCLVDTQCTSQCRDLLINTRSELDCCLNTLNVSSEDARVFNYSLWSSCGVEFVTEECRPSTIDLSQIQVDLTCTDFELQQRLYSEVICRHGYLESLQATLTCTEGCEEDDFLQNNVNACTVNEEGDYCSGLDGLYNGFSNIEFNCQNTDSCIPQCIQSLQNFTNDFGCCVNFFNQSDENHSFLAYEFWMQCGLATPGFCQVRLNDNPIPGTIPSCTTLPTGGVTSSITPIATAASLSPTPCIIALIFISLITIKVVI